MPLDPYPHRTPESRIYRKIAGFTYCTTVLGFAQPQWEGVRWEPIVNTGRAAVRDQAPELPYIFESPDGWWLQGGIPVPDPSTFLRPLAQRALDSLRQGLFTLISDNLDACKGLRIAAQDPNTTQEPF